MAAGLLFSGSVHAAGITWSNVQNISGPGNTTISTSQTQGGPGSNVTITNGTNDVSTLGTQVFGINYSGSPGSTYPYDATINGQAFYNYRDSSTPFSVSYSVTGLTDTYSGYDMPGLAGQSYGSYNSAGVGPNPDYTLANGLFSFSPTGAITLGNLTTGHKYLVQFWVSDPRGGMFVTRVETLASSTGGDTNMPTLAYEAPGSVDGQWVTGTFVADTTGTETLDLAASNTNVATGDSGSAQVNLLQLRDITAVPEPASLGLAGLGALAVLARRRRA